MKIFKKEGLIRKLIFVLVAILLFSAVLPNTISYAVDGDLLVKIGGKLLEPIMDLIVGIGDIFMDFIHDMIFGNGDWVMRIDLHSDVFEFFATFIVGLFVAAVVAVVAYLAAAVVIPALIAKIGIATLGWSAATTGASLLSKAAVGAIVVSSIVTGGKAGVVAGAYAHSSWFGDEAVLTLYQITPEEIFSGEIDMLNANFFSTEQKSKNDDDKITDQDRAQQRVFQQEYDGAVLGLSGAQRYINEQLKGYGYTEDISISYGNTEINIPKWKDNNGNTHTALIKGNISTADGMDYGSITLTIYRTGDTRDNVYC